MLSVTRKLGQQRGPFGFAQGRLEHGRNGGIALIATLVLLVSLTMLIAVVFQGNMTQRKYIRLRQEEAQALCLAESGVNEAIRAIARQGAETTLERAAGAGAFRVRWQETQAGANIYEVRAVGIVDVEDADSSRREVTVHVQVSAGHPARILSWQSSSASHQPFSPGSHGEHKDTDLRKVP